MDLEHLNRTQIILLTLLVSFVTSIATGIVTVTLMDQAPPGVTQTINRVVERTVERVVPAAVTSGSNLTTVIEKETTVVVKEDDLITASIENNNSTLARLVTVTGLDESFIATTTDALTPFNNTFYGIGVFVGRDGLIVTEGSVANIPDLFAITADGFVTRVEFVESDAHNTVGLLRLAGNASTTLPAFKVASFADTSTLKLGQTVIALQGESRTNVTMGIIADVVEGSTGTEPTEVYTNVANITLGSPLINIFGEVVGIDTTGDKSGAFTASNVIQEYVQAVYTTTQGTSTEAL